ncbi:hypothetical protein BH09VER1_BH09VER1_38750 [soil metagenome]
MTVDQKKTKLAVLEQDFETMNDTIATPGYRRVFSDLIDCGVTVSLALGLDQISLSPFLSLLYFLVRDLIPPGCSIGKLVTGLRIYDANTFAPASLKNLVIRGVANTFIVIPIAALAIMFSYFVMACFFACGAFFFIWWRKSPSISLRFLGYDNFTGTTVADWIASTHLIFPRDILMLSRMRTKIDQLRTELGSAELSSQAPTSPSA